MDRTYLVITSRKVYADLTKEQMERKVFCLNELGVDYELFESVVITKIVYRKIKK